MNLSVLGLKLGRALALALPVAAISAIGGGVARLAGPRTRRQARTLRNIARALPELDEARRQAVALGMWDNFGRTVAESLVIDRIAADPGRVSLAEPERAAALLARPGGTVFVGLHFGNWEATIMPALSQGQTPIGLYKALVDPEADAWLLAHRREFYPGGLLAASRSSLVTVMKRVRAGGSVCLLADHRDPGGVAVPFFGMPAPSVALPGLLAAKCDAKVLAARVDRLPGARFRVHLEEVVVPRGADESAVIEGTTAAIQALFERWIRAAPQHWVWFYKRWTARD